MDNKHPAIVAAVQTAIQAFAEQDELVPMWFLGKEGEKLDIVATPFKDEREKDMAAAAIKRMVAARDADFVFFVSECWTLFDQEAAQDYVKNRHKYPGGIVTHPKRQECVLFDLQTRSGYYMGSAPVLAERKLGEIEWRSSNDRRGGRFGNMLPPRGPTRADNNNRV